MFVDDGRRVLTEGEGAPTPQTPTLLLGHESLICSRDLQRLGAPLERSWGLRAKPLSLPCNMIWRNGTELRRGHPRPV